jgi:coenzyme F420 hydrogenase subunit beta
MTSCSKIKTVVEKHLCCGCGACVAVVPGKLEMVDVFTDGLRPRYISKLSDIEEKKALAVCPGIAIDYRHKIPSSADLDLLGEWGPVLDVLEGYSIDNDIRLKSSSGGVVTALAAFGISSRAATGVLQVGASKKTPYKNETRYNTTVEQVLNSCGSRYSPASPCEKFSEIIHSEGKSIFIGKPCDVAALYKARKVIPELDEKILLTVSIFCAATPSTQGTTTLINQLGENNLSNVRRMRYRGYGWPGNACIESAESETETRITVRERSYEEAWGGTLSRYRQWRCNLCADHTGEFADISVGDPWYRDIQEGEAGSSLIIPRTKAGANFLAEAKKHGVVTFESIEHSCLPRSQPYLINVAGMIWGRILALKFASIFGVGFPKLEGKNLIKIWLNRLTPKQKIASIAGTLRRVVSKGLWKKNRHHELEVNHDR